MTFQLITGADRPDADFPSRLARWLTLRGDLIGVLIELRRTRRAADAVATLLAFPDVEEIRTAWERWLTFVDDADRAASLLLHAVRADLLADAIFALWAVSVSVRTRRLSSRKKRHDPAGCQMVVIKSRTPRTCQRRGGLPPC
jgi:hypothetical protein